MDKAIAGVEPLNAFKLLYFMNLNILAFIFKGIAKRCPLCILMGQSSWKCL
jgi:hypothetical protein